MKKNRADMAIEYNALFPTNNAKLISAARLRTHQETIKDSQFNLIDDDAFDINFANGDFLATNLGDAILEVKGEVVFGIKAERVLITSWAKDSISNHSHGANTTPIAAIVNLVCKVAENGLAVGDRITILPGGKDQDGSADYNYGISVAWTGTTQFRLHVGSRLYILYNNGGSSSTININAANYNVEVTLLYL